MKKINIILFCLFFPTIRSKSSVKIRRTHAVLRVHRSRGWTYQRTTCSTLVPQPSKQAGQHRLEIRREPSTGRDSQGCWNFVVLETKFSDRVANLSAISRVSLPLCWSSRLFWVIPPCPGFDGWGWLRTLFSPFINLDWATSNTDNTLFFPLLINLTKLEQKTDTEKYWKMESLNQNNQSF